MKGGDDFAPLELGGAIGVDDELGVVERAAVLFVDADAEHHLVFDGGLHEGFGERAGDFHRVIVESEVGFAGGDGRLDEREIGVVGNESLGEDRELNAFFGGVRDGSAHFGHGGFPTVEVGCDLNGGGADGRHGGVTRYLLLVIWEGRDWESLPFGSC